MILTNSLRYALLKEDVGNWPEMILILTVVFTLFCLFCNLFVLGCQFVALVINYFAISHSYNSCLLFLTSFN